MLFFSNRQVAREPVSKPPQEPQPLVEIYMDEAVQPKYAQGTCSTEGDCTPAGCGGEVCSDDPGLITTCEVKPDAPDPNIYKCGCVEDQCVWYK